jgi:60 kDa SS-A/Ro ribonucleoprotein
MAKLNVKRASTQTHEGASAYTVNAELQLRRSVMACMLWEREFYEDGDSIADRIKATIPLVAPEKVAPIAIEAREKMKLRHVPLLIVREMARLPLHKALVATTLAHVIQRPDELTEFLAIYWKNGREKLSGQVKKGLASAFPKFDEYRLAKYNRDGAVKLKDVLFLCHAKPKDDAQAALWKRLIAGTLQTPDTWETELSAGKNKKATWERLISEKKIGALALLRNLRNMQEAMVGETLITSAIETMKAERVLPFRFIAAARHAPNLEPNLETAMFSCLSNQERLHGKTLLLVDVSGSMNDAISSKSDLTRLDAACGLAMLIREVSERFEIVTFSDKCVAIPPRRGFALRDAIVNSQPHSGTYLGQAVATANAKLTYDRLIVITDEQSADAVPAPKGRGCVINVASSKNGVGYGPWTHIDGWSEAVVDYLREIEVAR